MEGFINWIIDGLARNVILGSDGLELYMRLKSDEERAWVSSIGDDKSVLVFEDGRGKQDAIYDIHKAWSASLKASLIEQPFRTCFRITPPEEKKKSWKLDYLLQARDDRSLLIHVKEIWENYRCHCFLQRNFENYRKDYLKI